MRSQLIWVFTTVALVTGSPLTQQTPAPDPPLAKSVEVPFDHAHPSAGTFPLYYELAAPFDPSKPTVFVVADGQQFYVRRNAVRGLQQSLFGERFNVVGISGRGTEAAVIERIGGAGDEPNWQVAWTLLRSDQWVEDIERVRQALLGSRGRVCLYGRSGGGLLVHQYLSRYGAHASTVFTQAAVNRFIDAELGLNSDTFWADLGRAEPRIQTTLLEAIARRPHERTRILLLLQRQNFFVPSESLSSERAALIQAIASSDDAALRAYAGKYQIEEVLRISRMPPVVVRLFELFAPILVQRSAGQTSRVDPDLEIGEVFSAPLMQLLREQRIEAPSMNLRALHNVDAEVYMVAGRFDHTADYRSQIALASRYPKGRLLLLADDHNFHRLQKSGLYSQLIQAALAGGIDGPRRDGLEDRLSPLAYREY